MRQCVSMCIDVCKETIVIYFRFKYFPKNLVEICESQHLFTYNYNYMTNMMLVRSIIYRTLTILKISDSYCIPFL